MMHQGKITKTRAHSFFPVWVRQRELRQTLLTGHSDAFYKSLYSSISPCHTWGGEGTSTSEQAILSLEFSPDGTLLVAGCDKNNFLMFDPLCQRLICIIPNAHENAVTNIKFLDSRIFAAGSIDETISLWDTRNLKSRFHTLHGHAHTIGNIEISRKNEVLITSGYDGTISIYDSKNWVKKGEFKNNTFMSHLVRLRLNPEETKMIISTENGYILIVHELDLNTIAEDLKEFEMGTSGFADLYQRIYPSFQHGSRSHSQNRPRNRVEMVADFPNAGGFNVISALEIHPRGWCAFTRSTCKASGKEWTCVHNIQERESSKGGTAMRWGLMDKDPPSPQRLERVNEVQCNVRGGGGSTCSLGGGSANLCVQTSNDSGSALPVSALPLERGVHRRRSGPPVDTERARSPPSASTHVLEPADLGSDPAFCRVLDLSLPHPNPSVEKFNRRVHVHFPRLTHYIEEPYFSKWYIESLGVSADGRLVCSPVERSIRLLAFSAECSEQSVSWCGRKPRLLYEIGTHTPHSDSVMCTKFSPRHCLLVSGSFDGILVWYQPVV